MDVRIVSEPGSTPRKIEIDGAVYIEDVRGRFVPEGMHKAGPQVPSGIVVVNGRDGMMDAKGIWRPLTLIKPAHKEEDEAVRKAIAYALDLNAQIGRFKGYTNFDLGSFDARLEQDYGVTARSEKGNGTYVTHDGLYKIKVTVAELVDFGPEIHVAKSLIDECINDWSADSREEIQALVTRAFNTDKPGTMNRSEIFRLFRLDLRDPRWLKAMDALRGAMRVLGSKEYINFYQRPHAKAGWQAITIDLAKA